MKSDRADMVTGPSVLRAYGCAREASLELLGAWCVMGGYWQVTSHALRHRVIDESVLIACVDGAGWLRVGDKTFDVKAGDFFYCPASIGHGYGCEAGGWTIYWTHCRGRQVGELMKAAGFTAASPVRPVAGSPKVQDAFAVLVQGLAEGGPDGAWTAARNLHNLLHVLVWLRHRPVMPPRRLAGLVGDGCHSLDELVSASGYSRFHFCRLFKEETGQTPWQYVLERRLERARELLLGGQLSVKEISARLGFSHPDYFARLFKRSSGVTPRQYRG
jgi:AraC family transcriptional regulator of arabinose operon